MTASVDTERHLRQLVQTLLDSNKDLRDQRDQRDRARLDLAAVSFAAAAVVRLHDEFGQVPAECIQQLRETIERVST